MGWQDYMMHLGIYGRGGDGDCTCGRDDAVAAIEAVVRAGRGVLDEKFITDDDGRKYCRECCRLESDGHRDWCKVAKLHTALARLDALEAAK